MTNVMVNEFKLADRIATQSDRLAYWHHHCRSSVRPSICLWRCALRLSGSVCRVYQRVSTRQVPICPFRHFCCMMYCVATKCTKKRVEQNGNVSFLRQTIRRALVVLRSVIHWLRELLNFGLSHSMVTLE